MPFDKETKPIVIHSKKKKIEEYENIENVLPYNDHQWCICVYLMLIDFLRGSKMDTQTVVCRKVK